MVINVVDEKSRAMAISYLSTLPLKHKYVVTIKVKRDKRSVDQNSLYWLWLACISSETGQDKDSLHDYFKQSILGFETRAVFAGTEYARQIHKEISTKTLDTKQFTDFLEQIQHFAASELGIVLPNPEDRFWDSFYEQYKNQI